MKVALKILLDEVKSCEVCKPFLPRGPRPVIQLHPKASVLIVGQAPGRKVHETGIPFDDPSGERLRDWMGIDRATFYDAKKIAILPMGFCYPGTGKSGDLPPRPECVPTWREQLLRQIPHLKLTLVIGQYAQDYHLANSPPKMVTETVKAWKKFWPTQLPLPHPSPRNNLWLKRNPWFQKELLPILQSQIKMLLPDS